MKRAALYLSLIVSVGFANNLLTTPARADCGEELHALRLQLATVRDEQHRQEVQKLIEKAEKDDKAGRAALCTAAVQRARILLK